MSLRALIVDDEPLARRLLREYLGHHADIAIIGECEHGLAAVEAIGRDDPDLVLLDVQMPGLDGIEVLEASGRRHGVIFTTAYDQFAVRAFELRAIDYLLKPFSQVRFDEALARARMQLRQVDPALTSLVGERQQSLQRILVPERQQVRVIAVAEIDYVEAQDDYVAIHSGGSSVLKTQPLSELEAQLGPRFLRVHRSWLINLDRLQGLAREGRSGHVAVMRDGRRVPVSRSGQERLRAALGAG
ncbi:MAG TPA: LytTR family DNA-binding domain-containing protein [Arenimonas sp.]|nr:LytTR family DNA-binding domain-containing protein [Arenimonas sp.]